MPITQDVWGWAGPGRMAGREAQRAEPSLLAASAGATLEATNTKTVPTMVNAPPIPAIKDIAVDSDSATQLTH